MSSITIPGQPIFPSVPSMAQNTQDFVEGMLTSSRDAAQLAVDEANLVLSELTAVATIPSTPEPPTPPSITSNFSGSVSGSFDAISEIGEVTVADPPELTLESITIPDIIGDIPVYTPLITGMDIPEPPPLINTVLPAVPSIDTTVDLPATPTANYGEIPALDDISLPEFTPPTLAVFSATPPTFTVDVPSPAIDWAEPAYNAWIADQLKVVLAQMLAGGTGIPTVTERAIWERDRNRLDIIGAAAISDANGEWAGKGFQLPPGILLAKVDAVRRESREQIAKASRDVAIKQADLEQSNRQFAVKTGAELENMFSQIFLAVTQRSYDIAHFAVEARIQIFNTQVAAFNVENQIFSAKIEQYKAQLQFALSQIEAYKAQLEAQKLIAQVNVERINAFKAKIDAFVAQVEAYGKLVQAATTRAELQKMKVELYRVQVEGVATAVSLNKSQFEAYGARLQGIEAKGKVEEANARSYEARIRGLTSVAEIQVKQADVQLQSARYSLEAQVAAIQRLGTLASQQLSTIQAKAQAFDATTRRGTAVLDFNKSVVELNLQAQLNGSRNLIAFYSAQIETWKARVQEIIEFSRINVEAIKAAGTIAATLAAGRLAGTSVSAAFGGSVNRGETSSDSQSYNLSHSEALSDAHSVGTNTTFFHNIQD